MLNPVMNDTKWNELRLAMYAITPRPSWSTLATNGYRSQPDREWFRHFSKGGYGAILHIDIRVDDPDQREAVRSALKTVHVPGEERSEGFRVFGYVLRRSDGRVPVTRGAAPTGHAPSSSESITGRRRVGLRQSGSIPTIRV